jgi:hypothetical protein
MAGMHPIRRKTFCSGDGSGRCDIAMAVPQAVCWGPSDQAAQDLLSCAMTTSTVAKGQRHDH